MAVKYGPWKFSAFCQRPITGSKFYFGNFALGVVFDSHPRFVSIILCLLVVEFGVSWERSAL